MKPAHHLPASLKFLFFKKTRETGASPLFHARGAARVDCAVRRPRRPAGGRPTGPPTPSPPSFSFFLPLSLYFSLFLSFPPPGSLPSLVSVRVGPIRYGTVPDRAAGRPERPPVPELKILVNSHIKQSVKSFIEVLKKICYFLYSFKL